MNRHWSTRLIPVLGLLLPLAGTLCAQTDTPPAPAPAPDKTLVVNGKTAEGKVRQIDGRSYIDVEALAQIVNGVVSVEPNRIVLTIPTSAPAAAAPSTAAPQTVSPALSKEFASAAIAELAEMREWRGVIGAMVNYGLAVSGTWAQDYHDRVEASLRQAAVAASTDADKDAFQLLSNEFDTLSNWANDVISARQALNGAQTVDPNAQANDPALAKITNCSRFLNGMLVSGTFSDDGSCH